MDISYNSAEVGKRIKHARIAANLKQADLSEEMCISEEMLSKIERGVRMCTPDNMSYLCTRFNKTADYFYFGRESQKDHCKRAIKEVINEINDMLQMLNFDDAVKVYQIMRILIYS